MTAKEYLQQAYRLEMQQTAAQFAQLSDRIRGLSPADAVRMLRTTGTPCAAVFGVLLGTAALRIYETTDMYAGILNNVYVDGTIVFTSPLIVWIMLSTFISVNVGLAVFNLIPVPPLDGSKVLGYFTPANVDRWFQRNEQVVRIVFLALIVTGILDKPLEFLSGLVMSLLNFLTSWIPLVLH